MRNFIKHKLRGVLLEEEREIDICDDFSINSFKELEYLINKVDKITPEQRREVEEELRALKKANKYLSNDLDNFNTISHKISTVLCNTTNPENLD